MAEIKRRRELLTILVGGSFLLAILAAGWFPRSCPVLKQMFGSCPVLIVDQSPTVAELNKYPSTLIDKPLVEFKVKAQDYRETTDVRFEYRGDLSSETAVLGVRVGNKIERLATVTSPLLVELAWPRYSVSLPNETLYQREEKFSTIDDLRANWPASQSIAVDTILASRWNLDPTTYQPLEKLASLDGITTIATSYIPPDKDGIWRLYRQAFNVSSAYVNSEGLLEWVILMDSVNQGKEPFYLSTVRIDYRSMY